MSMLTTFSEAAYLLARFCPPSFSGPHAGRAWERTIASALRLAGGMAVQEPGGLTLFGTHSASGLAHELDGACARDAVTLVVEAKAVANGPTKN
ncbi:MAG: hypothetical protein L0Y66_21450, partial [Myxococcaceae bacterium]|nr:hypothetical protein [Myxococcaceae bacterium]